MKWHLPRGCVIKNVKIHPDRISQHPRTRDRPFKKQQQQQQLHHQQQQIPEHPENVANGQNESNLTARNNRRSKFRLNF